MKYYKLIKNKCEIDGCNITDPKILHYHHIVERVEEQTSHDLFNICIICPNHHAMVHSGKLKIIGVYPATKPPNNRIVVYELDGVKNIDIDVPYFTPKNKSIKIH